MVVGAVWAGSDGTGMLDSRLIGGDVRPLCYAENCGLLDPDDGGDAEEDCSAACGTVVTVVVGGEDGLAAGYCWTRGRIPAGT
jgi:hypothetical protein